MCSMVELRGMLGLTFTLVDLSSKVQFLTPCSTAEQRDATFEITTMRMTYCLATA